MAPKKKPPSNGYFYLLMDLRNKMDNQSADQEAARLWPQMSAAEREPYNMKAKRARNSAVKMTTAHENIDSVLRREQEEKDQEINMQEDIKSHIRYITDGNTITEEYFHIMHINNFFVTTDHVYYPAEIGLVRFNFKDGVLDENVYNCIIKPGKFPIGYAGTAKKASDETHKIPYMNTVPSNMEAVCKDIFDFLHESANLCSNPTKLPPIYVKDDFRNLVRDILFQMADAFGYNPDELRIYKLSFLLFTLRNDTTNSVVWPSVSQSMNELDKDVFDYSPEIPCEYHRYEQECPVHCSRSHVVRMAYILCDNCCDDLGITLIPGRHVPLDSVTEKLCTSSYASSVASVNVGSASYANSVSHSYRSNINTVDFDDGSTINNDTDLDWTEVQSTRTARSNRTNMSVADSFATDPSNKQAPRGPRIDWRDTTINKGRGRGRGIAANKK